MKGRPYRDQDVYLVRRVTRPPPPATVTDGSVTIGDRVRITAGDSFGELGMVLTLAEGPSQLYTVVLDSDDAVIRLVAERFVIVR